MVGLPWWSKIIRDDPIRSETLQEGGRPSGALAMPGKSLYTILGVSSTATRPEIKKQFYKLSKLYHPDAVGKTAEPWRTNKFAEISDAYSVLSDTKLRQIYDSAQSGSSARPEYTRPGRKWPGPKRVHEDVPPFYQPRQRPMVEEDFDPLAFQDRWSRLNKQPSRRLSEDQYRQHLKAMRDEENRIMRNRFLVFGTGVIFYIFLSLGGR